MKRIRENESEEGSAAEEINSVQVSYYDNFLLFKKIHPRSKLQEDDELFTKSSFQLKKENCKYLKYLKALEEREREKARARASLTRLREKEAADKFRMRTRYDLSSDEINQICDAIGGYLPVLIGIDKSKSFSEEDKKVVCGAITKIFGLYPRKVDLILRELELKDDVVAIKRIPLDKEGKYLAPSNLGRNLHLKAQDRNFNFLYPFPIEVDAHFPVMFCHPVFTQFLTIIKNWNSEKYEITKKVKEFYEVQAVDHVCRDIEKIVNRLIFQLLSSKECKSEDDLVEKIMQDFYTVFGRDSAAIQQPAMREESFYFLPKMDGAIFVRKFPFIIVKAQGSNFSLDAVLQSIQFYGLNQKFIDNDPCFLITFSRGLLFIYGIATVCKRVVCDCLLTLELTNYHFNINGILDKLHHSIGALYYFRQQFEKRLYLIDKGIPDKMNEKYSLLKIQGTPGANPWPGLIDVKSWENESERISFTFKKVVEKNKYRPIPEVHASFKKTVFLVDIEDEKAASPESHQQQADNNNMGNLAVLKVCHNYDIESHSILANLNLAPRIIGYEELYENCHVVLMEYLNCQFDGDYDCLFYRLLEHERDELILNEVKNALSGFLKLIHDQDIVHGDFRSSNILVKRDRKPSEDYSFKLIDFEFTGKVNTPYPCLSFKNTEISWHKGFRSYAPRKKVHDEFQLNKMFD